MIWGENDDKDVENCIKKLTEKITKLEYQLIPLQKLVQNCKEIQTRKEFQIKENKKILLKSKPLDSFGDEMDNKDRLARKKKCLSKATEILKNNRHHKNNQV